MRRLVNYFLRGLVVTAPVAITVYVCWSLFERVDRWLGLPIPGAGFAITILLITLVGFLASNLVTRGVVSTIDRLLERTPFARLLYSSTKDLLDAFVGEKRRFTHPVLVSLAPAGIRVVGFVTADALDALGAGGDVAVYLPHSYTFSGYLIVVSRSRIEPIAAESADVMAFIVSGGVTAVGRR